jgi:hypothetical protein
MNWAPGYCDERRNELELSGRKRRWIYESSSVRATSSVELNEKRDRHVLGKADEEARGVETLDGGDLVGEESADSPEELERRNPPTRWDLGKEEVRRDLTDAVADRPDGDGRGESVRKGEQVSEVSVRKRRKVTHSLPYMPRSSFIPETNAELMLDWSKYLRK